LWRYGWSADEAGLAFDDWKKEHQQEMLEVISMSCTDAGPNPFAEDLQPPPRTTPTGANPLEEGLGTLSLPCLRAGLFRRLFDALDHGRVALPGLAGAGIVGLGFEGQGSGSNPGSN